MSANQAAESVVLEEEFDPDYEPSQEEIIEYAQFLGMDLEKDKDLFWLAREGLKAPLPAPWKPCRTHDGEIYYFNFESGESVWEHPCDEYYKKLYKEEKQKKQKREAEAKQAQNKKLVKTGSGLATSPSNGLPSLKQGPASPVALAKLKPLGGSGGAASPGGSPAQPSSPLGPQAQNGGGQSAAKPSLARQQSGRRSPPSSSSELDLHLGSSESENEDDAPADQRKPRPVLPLFSSSGGSGAAGGSAAASPTSAKLQSPRSEIGSPRPFEQVASASRQAPAAALAENVDDEASVEEEASLDIDEQIARLTGPKKAAQTEKAPAPAAAAVSNAPPSAAAPKQATAAPAVLQATPAASLTRVSSGPSLPSFMAVQQQSQPQPQQQSSAHAVALSVSSSISASAAASPSISAVHAASAVNASAAEADRVMQNMKDRREREENWAREKQTLMDKDAKDKAQFIGQLQQQMSQWKADEQQKFKTEQEQAERNMRQQHEQKLAMLAKELEQTEAKQAFLLQQARQETEATTARAEAQEKLRLQDLLKQLQTQHDAEVGRLDAEIAQKQATLAALPEPSAEAASAAPAQRVADRLLIATEVDAAVQNERTALLLRHTRDLEELRASNSQQMQQLRLSLESTERSVSTARQTATDLQGQLDLKNGQVRALETELGELRQRLDVTQRRVEELQREVAARDLEKAQHRCSSHEPNAQTGGSSSALHDLTAVTQQWQALVQQERDKYSQLQRQRDSERQQQFETERQKEAARASEKVLEQQKMLGLEQQLRTLESRLQFNEPMLGTLRTENLELKTQLDKVSRARDAAEQSLREGKQQEAAARELLVKEHEARCSQLQKRCHEQEQLLKKQKVVVAVGEPLPLSSVPVEAKSTELKNSAPVDALDLDLDSDGEDLDGTSYSFASDLESTGDGGLAGADVFEANLEASKGASHEVQRRIVQQTRRHVRNKRQKIAEAYAKLEGEQQRWYLERQRVLDATPVDEDALRRLKQHKSSLNKAVKRINREIRTLREMKQWVEDKHLHQVLQKRGLTVAPASPRKEKSPTASYDASPASHYSVFALPYSQRVPHPSSRPAWEPQSDSFSSSRYALGSSLQEHGAWLKSFHARSQASAEHRLQLKVGSPTAAVVEEDGNDSDTLFKPIKIEAAQRSRPSSARASVASPRKLASDVVVRISVEKEGDDIVE